MARKKDRYKKDLRSLDANSPEYWEEILRREGLSMSAGLMTRVNYAGSTQELDTLSARTRSGLAPNSTSQSNK